MNSRRFYWGAFCSAASLVFFSMVHGSANTPSDSRPNIIIILTDDQGYADVGAFGAKGFQTPHLDRMAAEGMRFTNFYVSALVCSASRASLLTGCYAQRISIPPVILRGVGLHPDETTIAEMLKEQGYATALVGKWHLGQEPQFLPTRHGFDEFFGTRMTRGRT